MKAINLGDEVAKVLTDAWPAFAAAHPRLAEELDATILVAPVVQSLESDAEYQRAMAAALAAGVGAETVRAIIGEFVHTWRRRLM